MVGKTVTHKDKRYYHIEYRPSERVGVWDAYGIPHPFFFQELICGEYEGVYVEVGKKQLYYAPLDNWINDGITEDMGAGSHIYLSLSHMKARMR
jgi:hypothetical protein